MHMSRAALIPYALRSWELWTTAADWLGDDLLVRPTHGLCVAFTEAEAAMLRERTEARRQAGAEVRIIEPDEARRYEPGLSDRVLLAAHCPTDGFNTSYRTGAAFRRALRGADVILLERTRVAAVHPDGDGFAVDAGATRLTARRVVLAGGVWLEAMLRWFGVHIPVKTLVNQLAITERTAPVMTGVLSVAHGLLSLKQFANGTVLIGGGWQGRGDRDTGRTEIIPENLIGNVRLAQYVLPALAQARLVRFWLGFEAEVADAMPLLGPVPGVDNAFVIGSVHSGHTAGPFMAQLLAQRILGQEPELPLFDPARLLSQDAPATEQVLS
jgi:glycine/D-amino acid oxidase-like deaminating enzyme